MKKIQILVLLVVFAFVGTQVVFAQEKKAVKKETTECCEQGKDAKASKEACCKKGEKSDCCEEGAKKEVKKGAKKEVKKELKSQK